MHTELQEMEEMVVPKFKVLWKYFTDWAEETKNGYNFRTDNRTHDSQNTDNRAVVSTMKYGTPHYQNNDNVTIKSVGSERTQLTARQHLITST